jgi:hypothetical protein
MGKRVTDLTVDELDRLAAEAWFEASNSALKAGVPVVGRDGEKLIKRYPDGRTEILGVASPLQRVQQSDTPRDAHEDTNRHVQRKARAKKRAM